MPSNPLVSASGLLYQMVVIVCDIVLDPICLEPRSSNAFTDRSTCVEPADAAVTVFEVLCVIEHSKLIQTQCCILFMECTHSEVFQTCSSLKQLDTARGCAIALSQL